MEVAGKAGGTLWAKTEMNGPLPGRVSEVMAASRVGVAAQALAGFESQGGTLCTGPAIGVQQLGLQRRQQLNSLVTDDPKCQILLTWDGIQY